MTAAAPELAEGRLVELRRELARGPSPALASAPVDTTAKKELLLRRRERTLDLATDGAITRLDLLARLNRIAGGATLRPHESAAE